MRRPTGDQEVAGSTPAEVVVIDHEILSTVILSFPLIQEGQLSVSGMPYIFFFKIKNCLNDDLFISCDDRIGKMLHNICISAVAISLR